MASIFLSFVGNQDPTSGNTNEEGSIVSHTRELKKQQYSIRRFLLLYTADSTNKAEETKFWLEISGTRNIRTSWECGRPRPLQASSGRGRPHS